MLPHNHPLERIGSLPLRAGEGLGLGVSLPTTHSRTCSEGDLQML